MNYKTLVNLPIQQMLMALIGCIASGMVVIGLVDKDLSVGYGSMENIWLSLTVTISTWGMYGVQRRLSANRKLSKLISIWYTFLMMIFLSLYLPEFITQMWGILLFYPILISTIAQLKEYVYASGIFFLYFVCYTLFIPAYANVNADLGLSAALLRILLALGSVLLGGVLLTAMHQQKKRHEEHAIRQQKQQVLNMLQCFIPVGERKTQTSRKEIGDMSGLVKALWKAYGGEDAGGKDWEIELLSMLHFVSRVKLPDYMFEKEGKLSEFELEVVQEHCYMAKELCEGIAGFQEVQHAFLYHHEKIDGTGYPFRLSGGQIPTLSQMLGIVEVFLAMTTPRSYRQVLSEQAAYEELQKMAGSFFRPDIIEAFGKVVRS